MIFRNWVLQNFPFIEDDFDALTDYELFSKVTAYMKESLSKIKEYQADIDIFTKKLNEFEEYFETFLKQGKDILHVTLSSGISGSYNSANIAQAALQQSIGEPPPSATAKSALFLRRTSTQAFTLSVVGFGLISDKTSTIEGAELYTVEINSERFRGKFGSEYRTPEYGNKGFDINVIYEEYAKEVFRSYRKLEELEQGLIQEYGSENLIIAMYDAKVRGADPFVTGHHIIDVWYRSKQDEWERRFEEAQQEFTSARSYKHGTPFDYVGGDFYDER